MKRHLLVTAIAALGALTAAADQLVILHTNDTHSQIDPAENGLGGVMRRKALIDSVRQAESNVLLIDAGDAVQGTLYFTLFRGDVEHKVMNHLGYDIAILGNHDFDNGMAEMTDNIRANNATWISANYTFEGTPLDSVFLPYTIREFDGKRIAFMGLNLNPSGMISDSKRNGVVYHDIYDTANSTAYALKHRDKVDMVVAVTHIGYDSPDLPCDTSLVARSRDIDVVIGGHSHTRIDDSAVASHYPNLDGRQILIAQNSDRGPTVGKIVIDLDDMSATSSLMPVDSRYDGYYDTTLAEILHPYKAPVDSLLSIKIGRAADNLDKQSIVNLFADMVRLRGKQLIGKMPDLSLLNNGGIRNTLAKGDISEGSLFMVLPFDNVIEVVELSGADLLTLMSQINKRDINGLSDNVRAKYDPATLQCVEVTIDGKPIDPNRTYILATIDYLAEGGDYLDVLRGKPVIAKSDKTLFRDMFDGIKARNNKPIKPDTTRRNAPL